MSSPLVTVAIVPRERFSFANKSLDNILETTTGDYELIYVDGNSPPAVRDHVARQAAAHSFRVVRSETYLSPNQARNLAVAHARTKYVVFVDNDVLVSPGWLEALVDCAEQTGAWVVGPVYCERLPAATRIHMAGGEARFEQHDGRRVLRQRHRFYGKPLAEMRPQLRREPTEQIEFHCALARRDVFDRLGALDEQLWSAAEHTDLCLAVREAGGEVYLEPESVITYVPPPPFTADDRRYFMLRWSHAWNAASVERFRTKWQLAADDPALEFLAGWLNQHRQIAWYRAVWVLRRLGATPARWLQKRILGPVESWINRRRYPHVECHLPSRREPDVRRSAKQPSHAYAQTNLQLYNQLIAAGCSEAELSRVRDAYQLAIRVFTGHFRADGKPFVSHLVGVASILAAHGQSTDLIAAGLLHSIYTLGELGDGSRGMDPAKRQRVRDAVGENAEALVAAYTEMQWGPELVAAFESRPARLTVTENAALRIKLADALDDQLDGGLAFAPRKQLCADMTNGDWLHALIRLARASGDAAMADELAAQMAGNDQHVPDCLTSEHAESIVVTPVARRRRLLPRTGRRLWRPGPDGRRAA